MGSLCRAVFVITPTGSSQARWRQGRSSSLSASLLARVPLVLVSSEDKLTEMESLSLEHFPLTPMLMIIITDIMKIITKELLHKIYLVVANVEEECEENYRKNCFIEYEKIAFNETVEICRTPLVEDCDVQGPEICRTEYESECWTKQEVHDVQDDVVECRTEIEEKCQDETSGYTTNTKCSKWPKEVCSVSKKNVKKYTPITGCTKEPRELCAPAGCGFKQGSEECYDKTQTVVQDAPKEECSLEPQRTCKHVTKLVPKPSPIEECVDVPKEVCTRSRTNPKKVKKPVVKKWCYVPSEESGLA